MDFNYSLTAKDNYLEALVEGNYDLDAATDAFRSMLDQLPEYGLTNILIDHRHMTSDGGGIEKALYGFEIESAYLNYLAQGGGPLRLAFLAAVANDYDPAAEVAQKIPDFTFEIFLDYDQAISWLTK